MGEKSKAYQRGLDGESTARSTLDSVLSMDISPSKEQQDAFEQGKMDRARIEAEAEARKK